MTLPHAYPFSWAGTAMLSSTSKGATVSTRLGPFLCQSSRESLSTMPWRVRMSMTHSESHQVLGRAKCVCVCWGGRSMKGRGKEGT